jgi:hypothetical protein
MTLSGLLMHWRARAAELERFAPAAAIAFREAAEQLEDALRHGNETVSLNEASVLGGYSVEALQRMVASGRIENAGRKGKPRIGIAHVPTKPGHAAPLQNSNHRGNIEPTAIVASVISRKKNP